MGFTSGTKKGHPELFLTILLTMLIWTKFIAFDKELSVNFSLSWRTALGGVGVLLILIPPISLLPKKLRGAAFIMLDIVLSLLLLANRVSLRYYMDLFSLRNLGLSTQAWEVADSVWALLRPADLLLFADLLILLPLLYVFHKRDYWKPVTLRRASLVVVCMALGALGLTQKLQHYNKVCPGAMTAMWDRPAVSISLGSLSYHAVDFWNTGHEFFSQKKITEAERVEIERWLAEWNAKNEGRHGYAVAKNKNLIVIQVEALQEFVLGLKVGDQEVTPHLNALRKRGLYFSRAYNQTALGNSSDAEFMVNTSLFPVAKGVAYVRYGGNRYRSIGNLLQDEGYKTLAFHGDRPGFWNRNHVYPSIGFERYISNVELKKEESIGLGLSDKSFFKQSLEILKEQPSPFYAFLITLTSHYPFNFPELKEQLPHFSLGKEEGTLLGDYLRSIHYADEQLGAFIEGLEEAGILKNSLLVVYGDHPGVPLPHRAELANLLGRNLDSPTAWRDVQKIPLLFYMGEGSFLRGEDDSPTGQMDVAPTIANLMGIEMAVAFGRDLLNSQPSPVLFRNGTYVVGEKWVDPGLGKVRDLQKHRELDYTESIQKMTEKNQRHLSFSDRVIESDLIPHLNGVKAE